MIELLIWISVMFLIIYFIINKWWDDFICEYNKQNNLVEKWKEIEKEIIENINY